MMRRVRHLAATASQQDSRIAPLLQVLLKRDFDRIMLEWPEYSARMQLATRERLLQYSAARDEAQLQTSVGRASPSVARPILTVISLRRVCSRHFEMLRKHGNTPAGARDAHPPQEHRGPQRPEAAAAAGVGAMPRRRRRHPGAGRSADTAAGADPIQAARRGLHDLRGGEGHERRRRGALDAQRGQALAHVSAGRRRRRRRRR
jgi:hypothetical protein